MVTMHNKILRFTIIFIALMLVLPVSAFMNYVDNSLIAMNTRINSLQVEMRMIDNRDSLDVEAFRKLNKGLFNQPFDERTTTTFLDDPWSSNRRK